MKKITFFRVAAVAVMMAAGVMGTSCGGSKKAATSVTDAEAMKKNLNETAEVELSFPCDGLDSNEEFFRCNGTAKSVDRGMARDKAYQDALARLSTKLDAVAASSTKAVAVSGEVGSSETGMNEGEVTRKAVQASKTIAKANVAGYRTACEKFTKQGNSYNCYVTIEYGKRGLVEQLFKELKKTNTIKADYNFDKYMEEFDKDLKEYEASKQQ